MFRCVISAGFSGNVWTDRGARFQGRSGFRTVLWDAARDTEERGATKLKLLIMACRCGRVSPRIRHLALLGLRSLRRHFRWCVSLTHSVMQSLWRSRTHWNLTGANLFDRLARCLDLLVSWR